MPVDSAEGRSYLGAMAAAANYGRANRQLLTHAARDRSTCHEAGRRMSRHASRRRGLKRR